MTFLFAPISLWILFVLIPNVVVLPSGIEMVECGRHCVLLAVVIFGVGVFIGELFSSSVGIRDGSGWRYFVWLLSCA